MLTELFSWNYRFEKESFSVIFRFISQSSRKQFLYFREAVNLCWSFSKHVVSIVYGVNQCQYAFFRTLLKLRKSWRCLGTAILTTWLRRRKMLLSGKAHCDKACIIGLDGGPPWRTSNHPNALGFHFLFEMPQWCIAYRCTNPSDMEIKTSWHRLPLENKELLSKWLAKIRRTNTPVNEHSRLWLW